MDRMTTTRVSLLVRIRNPHDSQAWTEFHNVYAPIIYGYAKARGLQHNDAQEVQSACYESIIKQIPSFEYDREQGGFKAWLRTIVNRRVVDLLRRRKEVAADVDQLATLPGNEETAEEIWEQHWKNQLLRHCFLLARSRVSHKQYDAFRLLVEENAAVSEVENLTGMNANQIYKAKARVLAVIRELYLSFDGAN